MNIFKYLFYFIFIFIFIVPDKSAVIIDLFGIGKFNVFQFCALFMPFFYALSPKYAINTPTKLKKIILVFLFFFIVTAFFKSLYFSNGLTDFFKDYRIASIFIAALIIILFDVRVNLKHLFYLFLISISISYLVSLAMMIFGVTISSGSDINDGEFSSFTRGRLFNANKDFAMIGLFLLFKIKSIRYLLSWKAILLIKFTSILSIILGLLSYDRTLLGMLVLISLYYMFTNFSFKVISRLITYMLIAIFTISISYNNNDSVKAQVDKRILSLFESEDIQVVTGNVWEGNRDFMIMGALDTFAKHPFFGTNQNDPIFYYPDGAPAMQTDVTFVNILARHGIVGFILFVSIFITIIKVFKRKRTNVYNNFLISLLNFSLLVFLMYSLNHDTIFRGSIIIFIAFLVVSINKTSKVKEIKYK